jgi:phenylacetic acid degradation operon negative regulatory protein
MSQLATNGLDPPTMKPRSVILDLFGDYLRYSGSEVRAGDLIALLAAFGIEPATARVTLSRLRKEGWFTTRRQGRETIYTLGSHLLTVLDKGRARIFADYDEEWDRTWTTVIHQSETPDRLARDRLRRQLSWLGFGQLTTSTWLSPRQGSGNIDVLISEFPDVIFTLMRSHTEGTASDRDLADRCWDLRRIDDEYQEFLISQQHLARTAGSLSGAEALVARTTLIAAYRHFPYSDPWLPVELRPDSWHGHEANQLFRSAHRELGPAACEFVSGVTGQVLDTPAA